MIGIELKERSQPHLVALMEEGVLALPAGKTVIRLLPPLVIDRAQIEAVVAALCKVLSR
jgi:acetylornithine/LysW-gamma-L-lysine aminotransferase